MDRDWLTTHSGKTLLAFNQTRVPGLESGTNWSDSTRPLRSYRVDLQYNFEFYPTRPSGFFIMSADTESIRIDVAGTVLSPARKFGGSYLRTMRATSEVFAMDATRECFEYDFAYELSRTFCRPLFYRVRDSAPDGSSPRDYDVLLVMEDNLKIILS